MIIMRSCPLGCIRSPRLCSNNFGLVIKCCILVKNEISKIFSFVLFRFVLLRFQRLAALLTLQSYRQPSRFFLKHAVAYGENFHERVHSVAYSGHLSFVCAVCDVTIWRHIHVSKLTFWRSLLIWYAYSSARTRLILCVTVLKRTISAPS